MDIYGEGRRSVTDDISNITWHPVGKYEWLTGGEG